MSYRIPVGFGVTEDFGVPRRMLSWKGHLELLGKTEEERLGWRWRMPRGSFQQIRKCVSWCGRGP